MTHASISRLSLALALISLFFPASTCRAQEDQWNKHMKAAEKDYEEGRKEKYVHAWGYAQPYPHFLKAEQELEAALAAAQSFPPGDLRRARTLSELSLVYVEEGKFTDAEDRGKQSVAIMEGSLPPDDPRLGIALIGLAMAYASDSKTDLAAPLWSQSLGILGKKTNIDPEILKNLNFVAQELGRYGNSAGATQILQFMLDLQESTGVSDKDLRNSLERLARTQGSSEEGWYFYWMPSDAEKYYLRILEIDKRLYSPDSPETVADSEALGKLYVEAGKYAAALPLLHGNLQLMQAGKPPDNESKMGKRFDESAAIRFYRLLAQAYLGTGKAAEAEEVYKRLITMDESEVRSLGETSQAEDLTALSGVYRAEHRYDDALAAVKRSEVIDDEIANAKFEKEEAKSGTPTIWFWLNEVELAEIYREKGDFAAAEPLFQHSLERAQKMQFAPGHPKLAEMLDNYATLLRDEGKYGDAEPLYKRSLDTWAKGRATDHPDAAKTLTNYAALLRKLNRPAEAEPLEARAAAIRAKLAASAPLT
ncbi:MAG: tetratricopeptide repeat protein [Candidatus Acidiferrales bacterium]